MQWMLNISTHQNDLETLDHNWENARQLLQQHQFDGFELYPVDGYAFSKIPSDLIQGVHLRFFPIMDPIWHGNRARLLEIFDDDATIEHFYGGLDREAVISVYRKQLDLAHDLGAKYVVFHAAQCELEHIYQWNCPWDWRETIDMSAEIISEVMQDTRYGGEILFENLWWPGSLRLDSPAEIERLMEKTNYSRCGIVLDTGHILNKNQTIRSEREGIDYIVETVKSLGASHSLIRAVHLTRSLSAEYVIQSRQIPNPFENSQNFWDRFIIAHQHVMQIDQHDPFDDPSIERLFDWIDPQFLIFEFTYRDMAEWNDKIARQRRSLPNL